ncbi:fibroblast growth factor-binding protein 2-like [Conger conger]|uniref:fibroblast growth factor-binding protein 2-like n=1 Tax=Conger conger TaxID=82655 RepID=UPI002A5AAE27|nr:fibroblast growth factor-binding protein 2-like [Conger conger]
MPSLSPGPISTSGALTPSPYRQGDSAITTAVTMAIALRTPLILACCLWAAAAQNDSAKKSVWDDPVRFSSKAKDACMMHVSGQGDFTKLRISCRSQARSYYCDYQGKPNFCRAYSTNPRHYFTQIMWELRKLPQACQGPKVLRATMCKKAPEEAQMVFVSAWPKPTAAKTPAKITYEKTPQQAKPATTPKHITPKPAAPKPVTPKPADKKPQPAKPAAKAPQPRKTTPKPTKGSTTPKPTEPTGESRAVKMAQEYCWKSMQGVCTYFISWFQR